MPDDPGHPRAVTLALPQSRYPQLSVRVKTDPRSLNPSSGEKVGIDRLTHRIGLIAAVLACVFSLLVGIGQIDENRARHTELATVARCLLSIEPADRGRREPWQSDLVAPGQHRCGKIGEERFVSVDALVALAKQPIHPPLAMQYGLASIVSALFGISAWLAVLLIGWMLIDRARRPEPAVAGR